MALRDALQGITCPMVTPFDDGSIDEAALADLLEHLHEEGSTRSSPAERPANFRR